jgi:hypothetical protein
MLDAGESGQKGCLQRVGEKTVSGVWAASKGSRREGDSGSVCWIDTRISHSRVAVGLFLVV